MSPAVKRRVFGAVLVIVGAAIGFKIWLDDAPSLRSDRAMLATFQNSRSDLETLVRMAQHDNGLLRVDFDWTEPKNAQTVGVSPRRLGEYRALFRKIGLQQGFVAGTTVGEFDFIDRSVGLVMNGQSKSFVYTSVKVPVVDDLDVVVQDSSKRGEWFRSAGVPNWYLKFDRPT